MPQKRRTRRNVNKSKKVDHDASIMADGADEKDLQKEAFIRDFDLQGKASFCCFVALSGSNYTLKFMNIVTLIC